MSPRFARLIGVTALVVATSFCAVATAQAGIWTPVASNTTSDITAVNTISANQAWFGTALGGIFYDNAGTFTPATGTPGPGSPISAVKFSAGGVYGYATTSNGKLFHSIDGGATWTAVSIANLGFDGCGAGANAINVPALYGIDWASDGGSVLVVGGGGGGSGVAPVVLQSLNPTAASPSFANINGKGQAAPSLDGCRAGSSGAPLTDVAIYPGTPTLFTTISQYFGDVFQTTDGLTTPVGRLAELINNYTGVPRLAVDPANPGRIWAANYNSGGGDTLYFQYTSDGGASQHTMTIGGTSGINPSLYGLAYSGGTLLGVGDGGQILVSTDGTTAYPQPADGSLAGNKWLGVSMYDATHALVGGAGGALVASAAANTIPDLTPPAGTVTGPATTTVGAPTVFTANAVDNAGGSGIDPGSFVWSAPGTTGATGNPAALTFTGTGTFGVTVAFRDLAGNAATASTTVTVRAAVKPPTSTTTTTKVSVPGGTITLGTPAKCVPAKSSFTARLSLKRRNAKGVIVTKIYRAKFYIDNKLKKTDKKPPFTQKLTVKKLKPGAKHTLKAKAYIKLSNKKTKTKTIKSTFKVC